MSGRPSTMMMQSTTLGGPYQVQIQSKFTRAKRTGIKQNSFLWAICKDIMEQDENKKIEELKDVLKSSVPSG